MLKLIILGLFASLLATGLLVFKFIVYDPDNDSDVGGMFVAFDLLKDFTVMFMMLWYIFK